MQPVRIEFPQPAAPRAFQSRAFKRQSCKAPHAATSAPAVMECLECGEPVQATPQAKEFCCSGCRMRWNNRRMQRGAQIYDLWMSLRYERGLAKARGVWTLLCSLASAYRAGDVARRGGRRSWRKFSDAIATIPMAYSSSGDQR